TAISSAREPPGAATAMHPSLTLKCSHERRRESRSAFCSSRTALRLFFSSSRKIQKAMSLETSRGSFIGILAAMYALFLVRADYCYFAEHCFPTARNAKGRQRRQSTTSPSRGLGPRHKLVQNV